MYYVPHDEARTLPRSFPGLRRVAVRGGFPPHVTRAMRTLYEMGALSSTPVPMEDRTYPATELIARLLLALPASRSNPFWAYGLVVEVHGRKDGRPRTVRLHNRHPPPGRVGWGVRLLPEHRCAPEHCGPDDRPRREHRPGRGAAGTGDPARAILRGAGAKGH